VQVLDLAEFFKSVQLIALLISMCRPEQFAFDEFEKALLRKNISSVDLTGENLLWSNCR